MRITVFKKVVDGRNGKFPVYSTRLNKVDGSTLYARVRFARCEVPPEFPCIIDVDKTKANLSSEAWEKNGKSGTNWTLWVNEWHATELKYHDSSLDDIED